MSEGPERDGRKRAGRPAPTNAEELARHTGLGLPLAKLVAELNRMALQAGFRRKDVAAEFVNHAQDGEPPRYHRRDRESGEWVPFPKRISDQLSPRDRISPPDRELVDVYLQLFAKHTGGNLAALRKRIFDELYAAAEADYHANKPPRGTGLPAKLRKERARNVELSERGRELRELLEEKADEFRALEESHKALLAQVDSQQRQLSEQDSEMRQLRDQLARREAELTEKEEEILELNHRIKELLNEATKYKAEADQLAELIDVPDYVDEILERTQDSPNHAVEAADAQAFLHASGSWGSSAMVAVPQLNPYPGMRAFEPEDGEWFFGRDELVTQLVDRVRDRQLRGGGPLVVTGSSGAGKSSLLAAGLIPRLAQGALPGSDRWLQLRLTPTHQPLMAIATTLASITDTSRREHHRLITDAPEEYIEFLRWAVQKRAGDEALGAARLVLVVDHLEELFSRCADPHERHQFLDLISRLTDSGTAGEDPVALTVFGLRSDFAAQCVDYPYLHNALRDALWVGPMSLSQLREAILKPAEYENLLVETGLVEVMLRDLGVDGALRSTDSEEEAGRLPLLAIVLNRTWKERHSHTLALNNYLATGDIQNAVVTLAERAYQSLSSSQQLTARTLLRRLAELGEGPKRRVRRTELLGEGADLPTLLPVLDTLTQKRVLTQGWDSVEFTHEALLRQWPRLQKWLDAELAREPTAPKPRRSWKVGRGLRRSH